MIVHFISFTAGYVYFNNVATAFYHDNYKFAYACVSYGENGEVDDHEKWLKLKKRYTISMLNKYN